MGDVAMSAVVTRARQLLDEANATFYTQVELREWCNDGQRDIARRTEAMIFVHTGPTAVAGTQIYSLPDDMVRIHRVEFVPTGTVQKYGMRPATPQEIDSIFGVNQAIQGTPSYYVIAGFPGGQGFATGAGSGSGSLKMYVYPVPNVAGTFLMYYYMLPRRLNTDGSDDGDILDIPNGWDDLVVLFIVYRGLQKDRNPFWREIKAEYEEKIQQVIDVSRLLHDNSQSIINDSGRFVPSWLYEFES